MAQAKSSSGTGMNKEIARLAKEGKRVQIVGSLKNGKLQIDHDALQEIQKKWPNANIAFVAANAPFDPTPASEA